MRYNQDTESGALDGSNSGELIVSQQLDMSDTIYDMVDDDIN